MEEDTLLGLTPASLPVQLEAEAEMTLPSMNDIAGAGTGQSGWSFEKALQATSNNRHSYDAVKDDEEEGEKGNDNASESDDDDDEGDDGEEGNEESGADGPEGDDAYDHHRHHHKAGTSEEVVFRDGNDAAAATASGHVADGSRGDAVDDDSLLRISDKKEAKRLGKKLYKRWKKLNKKSRKHKGSKKERKSSSKDKSRKSKSSSEKGKDKNKHKKNKKARDDESDLLIHMEGGADANELGLVPAAEASDAAAEIEARRRRGVVREAQMRTGKATKKAAQRKATSAEVISMAKELVAEMTRARQMDDDIVHGRCTKWGAFPLHRVALKSRVQARCRQQFMAGALVEAGILQELSYWLYDVDRAEPAPYELRTTALDILLTLPLEGSIPMNDDLTQFMGISREHLIKTDLGRALNALRKYNDETVDNRGKCVQLLTAFSRVISGTAEREQNDENKTKAVWKCQRDPTVASPFEVLETGSEALQKSFMKPNPRDPTSYNGLLPWRPPAATITNVSGTLSDYIEKAIPRKR
jgi:hypothetical protein